VGPDYQYFKVAFSLTRSNASVRTLLKVHTPHFLMHQNDQIQQFAFPTYCRLSEAVARNPKNSFLWISASSSGRRSTCENMILRQHGYGLGFQFVTWSTRFIIGRRPTVGWIEIIRCSGSSNTMKISVPTFQTEVTLLSYAATLCWDRVNFARTGNTAAGTSLGGDIHTAQCPYIWATGRKFCT